MTAQDTLHAQLDDEHLDRLEALLDDPALEEAMRLDELQGYLCAALSGPQPIPEEDRLIDILGSEDALDSAAGLEAAAIIRRFFAGARSRLAAGNPGCCCSIRKTKATIARATTYRGAKPIWRASTRPSKTGSNTSKKTTAKMPRIRSIT